MESIQNSYRGLTVLFELNADRILYLLTVVFALGAGSAVGSLILSTQ